MKLNFWSSVKVRAAAAALCVASACPAAAETLIDIDFESGRKGFGLEGGAAFSITGSPVREGSKAGRFWIKDGRTEMKADKRIPKDTEIWAGWSVNVSPSFPFSGANITQFHGFQQCSKGVRSGAAGAYQIRFDGDQLSVKLIRLPVQKTVKAGSFKKGVWQDLLVNAKFSSSGGFFDLYVKTGNGWKKYEILKGHTFGRCPHGPMFKAGVYKGEGGGTSQQAVVFVDDIKVVSGGKAADVIPGKGSGAPKSKPSR